MAPSSSSSSSFLMIYITCAFLFASFVHGAAAKPEWQKTWCVAKPSSNETELYNNIEYACSYVDCSIIQKGGCCFLPDASISHASVAMNLYYRSKGSNPWNCYFSFSGITVITDPSYGDCKYA